MAVITYSCGTAYDPDTASLFWSSDGSGTDTDAYAFYFSSALQDQGNDQFAVLQNITRNTYIADNGVTASDYSFFIDFTGHNGTLRLNGGENDDVIYGGNRNDTLLGDDGSDSLVGGQGNDRMEGGAGNDSFYVEQTGDTVLEARGLGVDSVYATTSWTMGKGQEIEFLIASTPNSVRLTGNEFDQVITGADSRDVLTGLGGKDVLTGGGGADLFAYKSLADSTVAARGRDLITDFCDTGGDQIDLRSIDASTRANGNQAFTFIGAKGFTAKAGELQSKAYGADTLVSGDVNGDGRADFSILLSGHHTLDKGDFLL